MDNILQFPPKTHCGKPVPKAEFYRHLDVNTKMKQRFVEDVSSITWLYTLSPSTLNVQDGTEVHEVVVFLVDLKVKDCPNDVFLFIDKNMPRHVVFLLQYGDEYRFLLNYKERLDHSAVTFRIVKTFLSEWMNGDRLNLPIEGQSMDKVYEAFAGYVSGYGTKSNEDIKRMVELEKQIGQMTRIADALQKKVGLEKQVNRQLEMNAEAKAIKSEIASLNNELKELKK